MTASRLGSLSGAAVVAVGIAYAVVLAVGILRHGFSEPIADPVLAVMELLTIAAVLPLVLLVAAILLVATSERRIWGIVSLSFAVMFTAATCGVHFVELTAGRQLGSRGLEWPSIIYAVELAAWDLFLGVSLLFAAAALDPAQAPAPVRRLFQVTGALCLLGLIGPAVGNMRLQLIGVFGYAVMLPVAAFVAARWFQAEARARAA